MKNNFQNRLVVDLRRIEKKPTIEEKIRIFLQKLLAKKTLSWLFLGMLIFVFSISLILSLKSNFSPKTIEKNTVSKTPESEVYHLPQETHPRGLNLVFFADHYASWEEFDSDIDILMLGLRTIEPWKSYEQFNLYKIKPNGEKDICQVKTDNERKPVLRCNEEINTYLSKLNFERFKFIVLSRQDFQSWANVARIENSGIFFSLKDKLTEGNAPSYAYLFAHLMGHAFGLKDEEKFVIARANGAPHTPDGPNCAPDEKTAKKWWGNLAKTNPEVGYFKTCCGNENYIKPTQSSLMNLGSEMEKFRPNYGPVSQEYLDKILRYCYTDQNFSPENDPEFFGRYPEVEKCLGY